MSQKESFSDDNIEILEKYVSNIDGNVFVLKNLPEVIKGALFSKYSRSSLGLRSLLLKEFIQNEETSFTEISDVDSKFVVEQSDGIKKAQNFYDRILDGFGDDSIGELGGAHLAVENASMIAVKAVEDLRIGGSPLEKSTRYIYFDQKVNGEYQFYKEPVLMASAYRELYLETCNSLFETYAKLIPLTTELIQKDFPHDQTISSIAYKAALRAKVLDLLRGLLPSSALTNMGVFGNGRFFECLIKKLATSNLSEVQKISAESFTELSKTIPSFVRRAESSSKYQTSFVNYSEKLKSNLKKISKDYSKEIKINDGEGVKLINYDKDSLSKVLASLLFENSNVPLSSLQEAMKNISNEEIINIFDSVSSIRENRRHKSPRALENAYFTFEITKDFGIYRDLQRHRMLTQERQLLSCDLGYFVPDEIKNTSFGKEYISAMEKAKKAFDIIAQELPEEAQYIVPMAYNIRWYFTVNLRSLQWLCELRSAPAGHANYRRVAQDMVKQVLDVFPQFESFFKFVDFDGHNLGRMNQEVKRVEKEALNEK